MSAIVEDMPFEGVRLLPDSAEQQKQWKRLRGQLGKQQRRLLLNLQDETDKRCDQGCTENYYRGFCTGLWFAELYFGE